MTRKITLSVILILLIVCSFQVVFGNAELARASSKSVSELSEANKNLNSKFAELEKISNEDFEAKKQELAKVIKEYQESKTKYEDVVDAYMYDDSSSLLQIKEFENKDIYNVDFLWTIIGNYATEEGIDLTFNLNKNTTSASAISNTSTDYVVCDLKFVITGSYINLTDFIYDLEDDDRLNFEINDFEMTKADSNLQVTLNVNEIKISTLIETTTNAVTDLQQAVDNVATQIINSDSTTEETTSGSTEEKN